jgi:hypothetical protein
VVGDVAPTAAPAVTPQHVSGTLAQAHQQVPSRIAAQRRFVFGEQE